MTTRDFDIAKIEQDVTKGLIDQKTASKLIDRLYKQTKDVELETQRNKYITNMKQADRQYRLVRESPEKLSSTELKYYVNYFSKHPYEY